MATTILITGATDGIGREAALRLAPLGHTLLLHGRSPDKLAAVRAEVAARQGGGTPVADPGAIETYVADLSRLAEVAALAEAVAEHHPSLDVLINNAGVYRIADPATPDGLDARFAVNTIAPYLLTQRLLPLIGPSGRVINVSSAAQSPVDLDALAGGPRLPDGAAYAQSKLAITMWSRALARSLADGPVVVAVNPGSLLGTKMVREGYGITGADVGIGADILVRAALSEEFASASGQYFDNDNDRFAPPHPDALDAAKNDAVVRTIESVIASTG